MCGDLHTFQQGRYGAVHSSISVHSIIIIIQRFVTLWARVYLHLYVHEVCTSLLRHEATSGWERMDSHTRLVTACRLRPVGATSSGVRK